MRSTNDLTVAPDARWLKFRENYTTREHLVALHDDVMSLGNVTVAATGILHEDIRELRRSNAEGLATVARSFDDSIQGLRATTASGLHDLSNSVDNVGRQVENLADVSSRGFAAVTDGIGHLHGQMQEMTWEIESGFNQMVKTQNHLASVTLDGFHSLSEHFHWGLARIAHQMELNRQVYQDIRKGILYPAATQGQEFRERAETALENEWWDDSVRDLEQALEANPLDFLAHYHLGHVLLSLIHI